MSDLHTLAVAKRTGGVNLKRIIAMIDEEGWSAMDVDEKGAAFEGLLEKAASEGKKGTGQYIPDTAVVNSILRGLVPEEMPEERGEQLRGIVTS